MLSERCAIPIHPRTHLLYKNIYNANNCVIISSFSNIKLLFCLKTAGSPSLDHELSVCKWTQCCPSAEKKTLCIFNSYPLRTKPYHNFAFISFNYSAIAYTQLHASFRIWNFSEQNTLNRIQRQQKRNQLDFCRN